MNAGRAAAIVAILGGGGAASAAAQAPELPTPRKSQPAAVMQMVGPTRIDITYSRPVARGRDLFGALVPWGEVWNPGADTATAIRFSTPVRVNGKPLPAGAYSLWAVPGPRTWLLIFSRAVPVYHVPYPGEALDALRINVPSRVGEHMETLAFYFPEVEGFTATLSLHWGRVIVPLSIRGLTQR